MPGAPPPQTQLPRPPLVRPGMMAPPGPALMQGNVIRPGMGPPLMNAPPQSAPLRPGFMPQHMARPPFQQQPPLMGQSRPPLWSNIVYGSIISFSHLILRRVLILSYTKTLSCGCNYFTNNVLSCYLFALFPDLATTDHFQLEGYGRPGGHDLSNAS